MTQTAASTAEPQVDWSNKIRHGSPTTATPIKGRREFFHYKDLGMKDATQGRFSANFIDVSQGLSEPTGWHYHVCDAQFIYITYGWVVLQFEDGSTRKVSEGQTLYIEGGVRHNEISTSDTFGYLEVFMPGNMRTVACDAPYGWVDSEVQTIG